MQNSKLGNLSIAIPTESRLRTLTQIDDKSIMMGEQQNEANDKNFNQNLHIRKWLKCRQKINKYYVSESQTDNTKNSNCYMIEIEELGQISYRSRGLTSSGREKERDKDNEATLARRREEGSQKVYMKIIANLVNIEEMQYSSRSVQFNLLEMELKASHTYKVTDAGIALFFHSKLSSNSQYRIRLQFVIVESYASDLFQFVQHQEYIGYCDIDPFKGLKTKQKYNIFSPKLSLVMDSFVLFTVLLSDTFKPLQKLLPPNCLISSEQSLPGLAGRKLPSRISTLHYSIEYTELHSLRIDVMSVDINDSVLHNKLKEAEMYMRCMEDFEGIPFATIKEVKLEGVFHNGWTGFCESSIRIHDKMEIQRRNSKKVTGQLMKIKHYTTEQLFNLPFIFLDEEAILLLQISAKVELKTNQNSTSGISLSIPICYTYYVFSKLSTDQKQSRVLYLGEALGQLPHQFAMKSAECPGSKIEFYISVEHANKMQLSKHLVTIHSNKSNVNFNDTDRIVLEKERMIRENRKLKQINRIKKIQLNQDIPVLDTTNFKENIYRNQIERLRQERRQKQQVLQYLKKKIKQLTPEQLDQADEDAFNDQLDQYHEYQKTFKNRISSQSYYDSVFYKAVLQKNNKSALSLNFNPDAISVRMLSLFQGRQNTQMYACGEVPIDIINTQMLEKGYSYGLFFNWVSLLPASPERMLPRKFYFVISFFNHPHLQSCQCTVNQISGQISPTSIIPQQPIKQKSSQSAHLNSKKLGSQGQQLLKTEKQKSEKILFVEIGPNDKIKNNDSVFIEFISYLYHGQLQIRVFDALSKIEFGSGYFKMRDLIRVRRNQVEVVRDVWISKQSDVRAKLKLQVKVIRKQATKAPQHNPATTSQLQSLSLQPQARQLQRISQFKKTRQQKHATEQKIQRLLNTQLIKQQLYIQTFRMRGELIRIEVGNRKNYVQNYQITINDPDQQYLHYQQLVAVNHLLMKNIYQTRWVKFLEGIQGGKGGQIVDVDQRGCFQLEPGQVKTLLLYYYSQRKYEAQYHIDKQVGSYQPAQPNQQVSTPPQSHKPLKVYNHTHCIDLSLCNSTTRSLIQLYKVHIVPRPDPQTYTYTMLRKSNEKISITIPFPSIHNYVVYIDDPTVVSGLNQQEQLAQLSCTVGGQGMCRRFNVSFLSPFPQNRMLGNYCFQLWGAREIEVQGELWQIQEVLVDLHSSVCVKKGIQYVLVLTDDEKTVSLKQKNPIKVNQSQSKTFFRLSINPSTIGITHHIISLLSPVDLSTIYSYTLKINCPCPTIHQKITLRIKLTDKILEQPFNFRNEQTRKQKYTVLSTHPHILWCQTPNLEVEGRGEKKIKIIINAEQIAENQEIVLSFMGDKARVNYLFLLELDNML